LALFFSLLLMVISVWAAFWEVPKKCFVNRVLLSFRKLCSWCNY
jgi:hypothetical protein